MLLYQEKITSIDTTTTTREIALESGTTLTGCGQSIAYEVVLDEELAEKEDQREPQREPNQVDDGG